MSRSQLLAAVVVSSLAVGATAFAAQPHSASPEGNAERTCREHGVLTRGLAAELIPAALQYAETQPPDFA